MARHLKEYNMWKETESKLCASFLFTDFSTAIQFMVEVAEQAENQNHHPNWSNSYNKVEICLTTHDLGNQISHKDRRLAEAISTIYQKYGQ